MSTFDLTLGGGTVVIPGEGQIEADIGITGNRIEAVGPDLERGHTHVDAGGMLVLPGIIDPHAHLGLENSFASEARTETAAGLACGVTTVGLFLRSLEDPYAPQLKDIQNDFEKNAFTDAFFHLQIFNETQLDELAEDVAFGVTSFKFYMCGLPGVVNGVDDGFLFEGFKAVAAAGPGTIACVHAENEPIVFRATDTMRVQRPDGTLADWTNTHPDGAEAEAIYRASYLARLANCPLYIVHLSSHQGVEAARDVRSKGPGVFVETTSPYLSLDNKDANGFLLKMSPPVRWSKDRDSLWMAVQEGIVDTVGTDNTSRSLAKKNPAAGLHGAATGYPVLGTHLPALIEAGFHERNVPIETIAQITSRGPAEAFNLYPRKGTIAVGSDADLVVLDPNEERVVSPEEIPSFSDFSPFQGHRLRGWPQTVIKGGRVAVSEGRIVSEAGTGRYLPRPYQRTTSRG